jgi:hypothetical protein
MSRIDFGVCSLFEAILSAIRHKARPVKAGRAFEIVNLSSALHQ